MDTVQVYVLKDIEFMCMASMMDLDSIYGYKPKELTEEQLEKELKYTLFNLAKKRYIQVHNNKLEIVSALKEIYMIIANAEYVIDVKNHETNENIIIYRAKDKKDAVIITPSITGEDELRVSKIKDIDVEVYLAEEIYGEYTLDEVECIKIDI